MPVFFSQKINKMSEISAKSKPKCPQCGIEGIEYMSSENSTEQSRLGDAWFDVVFCNQCGHIHGIFNKVSFFSKTYPKSKKTIN
jgi:hypothetical protein